MRGVFSRVVGALVVPGLLVLAFHPGSAQADDTSFFGRLFRLGGSSSSSSSSVIVDVIGKLDQRGPVRVSGKPGALVSLRRHR